MKAGRAGRPGGGGAPTFCRGGGEHQRPAGRPLHLEHVAVAHLEREQRLALQHRVHVGQALAPRARKQLPVDQKRA